MLRREITIPTRSPVPSVKKQQNPVRRLDSYCFQVVQQCSKSSSVVATAGGRRMVPSNACLQARYSAKGVTGARTGRWLTHIFPSATVYALRNTSVFSRVFRIPLYLWSDQIINACHICMSRLRWLFRLTMWSIASWTRPARTWEKELDLSSDFVLSQPAKQYRRSQVRTGRAALTQSRLRIGPQQQPEIRARTQRHSGGRRLLRGGMGDRGARG